LADIKKRRAGMKSKRNECEKKEETEEEKRRRRKKEKRRDKDKHCVVDSYVGTVI
jgi:hypothetical protein